MIFTIYKSTNTVNGKVYVGQTRYSLKKRRCSHVSDALCSKKLCRVFHAAIRKYGPDVFTWEVLQEVETANDANLAEIEWIRKLNCRVPNGYNLAVGGHEGDFHEETRKLISANMARRWANFSPEKKREIKDKIGRSNTKVRETWSPEEYQKLGSDSVRKGWANMSPEAREARRQRSLETLKIATKTRWDNCTPEMRTEHGKKIWATRRAKKEVSR